MAKPEDFGKIYVKPEELHEMLLRGNRLYFHGSDKDQPLEVQDPKLYGQHKCTFLTAHFGYAMSYAFPIGSVDKYQTIKHFTREIVFDKPIYPRRSEGFIFPIMIGRINVVDIMSPGDARELTGMLWQSGVAKTVKSQDAIEELMQFIKTHDWLALKDKIGDPNCSFAGVTREILLEVIHKEPYRVGFSCYEQKYNDGDYGYPSIGIFHDKIPDWLKQRKPLRVVYSGERVNPKTNAKEYVITVEKGQL